jgi:hypothetical protein
MKKLLVLLFVNITLLAQSYIISNIPLPKTYIQDLDPYGCDESCMQEYLDKGMIFSFLSHANKKLENDAQNEIRTINISILNLGAHVISSEVKIAMLLPYKKIGKYASSTTNAVFAYLMTRSHPFELKSYKIESEDADEIERVLSQIKSDGFSYVIAPVTLQGAQNIINIDPDINIYMPTINKKDIQTDSEYLTFGAIDYKAQSDLLIKEAVSPLVIFSDKSSTGKKLASYEEKAFKYSDMNETLIEDGKEVVQNVKVLNEGYKVIKYFISRKTTNLEYYLKENEKIIKGTFFINTPIVKSGMIMSQLTLYDANATNLLSTQVNYDPLILSMTQYSDRKDMVVANSITEHNNVLTETNSLLGSDIVYDWINYATTVGIDYIFHLLTNEEKEYKIELDNNQMQYKVELLQPSVSRFIKYTHIERIVLPEEREKELESEEIQD